MYIPPCGFGFMPPVKPTMSVSQFKQSTGITVTVAFLFILLAASLGQESFATWTYGNVHAYGTPLHTVIRNSNAVAVPH